MKRECLKYVMWWAKDIWVHFAVGQLSKNHLKIKLLWNPTNMCLTFGLSNQYTILHIAQQCYFDVLCKITEWSDH